MVGQIKYLGGLLWPTAPTLATPGLDTMDNVEVRKQNTFPDLYNKKGCFSYLDDVSIL